MNNLHVKSTINEIKGTVKEEFGHATGNNSMMAKGIFSRIYGKFQNWLADLKDGSKKEIDRKIEQ